jgi:hypothetical protein
VASGDNISKAPLGVHLSEPIPVSWGNRGGLKGDHGIENMLKDTRKRAETFNKNKIQIANRSKIKPRKKAVAKAPTKPKRRKLGAKTREEADKKRAETQAKGDE